MDSGSDFDFEKLTISDRKIIVGIDFGTTYSGIAWAETQRHDRRIAITSWPISKTAREGESSDKVPTRLRYSSDLERQWGFTIPVTAPHNEIVEWFKLDLDPTLQSVTSAVSQKAARGQRNADRLVMDYLHALVEHLMYTLRQKLGQGVIKSTPLEFVLTVPAIWSDLAKDRTRLAFDVASTAIFGPDGVPVHLVSEPEAAAIYALHGLDPHGLQIGDSFVICDAGGGTVDLISYTISKLRPILEVQEATTGTGALCGSTFLNMRFAKFLRAKLGNQEGFDDELVSEALEKFEKSVKRQFTMHAAPNETWTIPVGGLANNKELGINRGRFSLKSSDLRTIFEPVVEEVISLVQEQITASQVPVSAVLLVGGFGASNYLKERLRNSIDKNIQIMQPPNAWLAVVHGAVMKGLAQSAPEQLTVVKVQTRKARRHYGTEWLVKYDGRIHSDRVSQRVHCGLQGGFKIKAMQWFLKRGSEVPENEPYFQPFCWTGRVSGGRIRSVKMDIYTDHTTRDATVFRDGNVSLVCRLEADLSHIPEELLNRRQGVDGNWYYTLSAKIEAVYLSASTQYTLIYNGQRYNTVTAEYV